MGIPRGGSRGVTQLARSSQHPRHLTTWKATPAAQASLVRCKDAALPRSFRRRLLLVLRPGFRKLPSKPRLLSVVRAMEQKEEVASAVNAGQEPAPPPHEGDLEAPLLPAEAAGAPSQNAPPAAQKDTLLYICAVLSIVTAVGGLLCMVVNLISLLRSFDYRGFDYRVSVFVGVLRFFAVAFALVVIVAETEWVPILRFWKVLDFWVGRGLLQVFVASLTYVLAQASGETRSESLLHEIASWWLLMCGIVYIVAGLLCLGTLKRNRMGRADWREQAQKDLEEVHRRREELEAQLHGHR